MAKSKKSADQPTFEGSIEQLQQIVSELESGALGLDASLARFEEGTRLLKNCHQLLEQAERRVQILTSFDEDGQAETEDFDAQRSDAEGQASQRRPRRSSRKKRTTESDEESDSGAQLF